LSSVGVSTSFAKTGAFNTISFLSLSDLTVHQQRYGGNRLNINVREEKNISSEELLETDAKALVALIAKVE